MALPQSLDGYRSGANWVVSLSTAAIGAGLALINNQPTPSGWALFFFISSALGFVVAIVAGVWLYFWLVTYAASYESRDLYATALQNATGTDKDNLEKAINIRTTETENAKTWTGLSNVVLLAAFVAGVALSIPAVILAGTARSPATTPPVSSKPWSIVTVPCCPTARCRVPQPHVLLTNAETGETWYMDSTATAAAVWRRVAFDSLGVGGLHHH